jgi:hypothetical protein
MLEVPGSKDIGIEFHSLSKTFNMTGCASASRSQRQRGQSPG